MVESGTADPHPKMRHAFGSVRCLPHLHERKYIGLPLFLQPSLVDAPNRHGHPKEGKNLPTVTESCANTTTAWQRPA